MLRGPHVQRGKATGGVAQVRRPEGDSGLPPLHYQGLQISGFLYYSLEIISERTKDLRLEIYFATNASLDD